MTVQAAFHGGPQDGLEARVKLDHHGRPPDVYLFPITTRPDGWGLLDPTPPQSTIATERYELESIRAHPCDDGDTRIVLARYRHHRRTP